MQCTYLPDAYNILSVSTYYTVEIDDVGWCSVDGRLHLPNIWTQVWKLYKL